MFDSLPAVESIPSRIAFSLQLNHLEADRSRLAYTSIGPECDPCVPLPEEPHRGDGPVHTDSCECTVTQWAVGFKSSKVQRR